MAKIYGSTIVSTFKPYMDYELTDKGAQMLVRINELGIYVLDKATAYTFGGLAHSYDRISYTFGGTDIKVSARSVGKGEHFNLLTTSHYNVYFSKTTSVSEGVCVGSISIPLWNRVNSGGSTELQSPIDTSVEVKFTIPALTKPMASITAVRDGETPTTLGISVTVNSFEGDEISSITVVDGNGNPLGSTSSTIVIPTSGQIVQPFVVQGVTTGSIVAKAVAIGLGGESAEESVVIPVAFFTMDVQKGGKEIAFGSSAIDETAQGSEHGIFNCFMDAIFHNGAKVDELDILCGSVGEGGTTGIRIGKWKICWGTVNITPSSGSGTFASPYYQDQAITGLSFSATPYVYPSLYGSFTGTYIATAHTVSNTGFTIRLLGSSKNQRTVRWFAIGQA